MFDVCGRFKRAYGDQFGEIVLELGMYVYTPGTIQLAPHIFPSILAKLCTSSLASHCLSRPVRSCLPHSLSLSPPIPQEVTADSYQYKCVRASGFGATD